MKESGLVHHLALSFSEAFSILMLLQGENLNTAQSQTP